MNITRSPPPPTHAEAPIHGATPVEVSPQQGLRTQIEIHDRYGFDLKIESRSREREGLDSETRYTVDAYLFIPTNFGINASNYPATSLFNDLKAYLRREPPSLWQNGQINPEPLARLERSLRRRVARDAWQPASHEQRMLVYGGSLRRTIKELFPWRLDARDQDALIERLHRLVEHLSVYRRFRHSLAQIPDVVHPSYAIAARTVDEAASYLLESELARVDQQLPSRRTAPESAALREQIRRVARREMQYRRRQGFCILHETSSGSEYFVYRIGQLKKAMDRVLYLDMRTLKHASRINHLIGGIGAAFAAAFAFLAHAGPGGLWAVSGLSTFLVFGLAVVAYILKDRIKDITKERLNRWWKDRTPDRLSEFTMRTQSGEQLAMVEGQLFERTRYIEREALPEAIVQARDCGHVVDVIEERREEILNYHKAIEYTLATVEDEGGASAGDEPAPDFQVKDLLRLNVRNFLEHLDDPLREISYFDPVREAFTVERAPKVYHLNIVLRYREILDDEHVDTTYERLRVVLNRNGITRIETVLPRAAHPWLRGQWQAERTFALEAGRGIQALTPEAPPT